MEPALYQLYRHTFVPYYTRSSIFFVSIHIANTCTILRGMEFRTFQIAQVAKVIQGHMRLPVSAFQIAEVAEVTQGHMRLPVSAHFRSAYGTRCIFGVRVRSYDGGVATTAAASS